MNNNNNFEIPLDFNETLGNEGIIQKLVKNTEQNYVELELNHKYDESSMIFPIAIIKSKKDGKGWIDFKELVRKELKKYGISEKHINQILTVLTRNYKFVAEINNNSNTENQNKQESENDDDGEHKSSVRVLIELVKENGLKLLKDEFKVPHIIVMINNQYYTLPIDSIKFKRYLRRLYSDTNDGKIANTESIESAISQLEAIAEFEGETIPLHLRVAWNNPDTRESIYYDLSNDKNRCVKITKDGWEVLENQIDVLFRKYNHLKPQVEPISTFVNMVDDMDSKDSKMFDVFMSLFNLKTNKENSIEDIKLLLKCYIISLFIPEIPKPILLLHGEQGGAKSTFQELIKMLVDPSIITTLTFPRDSNEFIQQLSHNLIAYYDNVSTIQEWISDLLCRAVTGNSSSKRGLYTNDDDFYYNFKRIVGINGIDLAATKADLLDRSIIIELERIDKKNRKKIKKIWEKFNQLKPYVLRYIFDILVKVLRYKDEHEEIDFPDGQNRMADWEEYAEIISRCMGNPPWEFQRVYQENIVVQIDEAIESSPLSQTVLEFMNEEIVIGTDEATGNDIKSIKEVWKGPPTKLHTELQNIAIGKLNLTVSKSKSWPKSASSLTRRINGIKTNLREKGIEIIVGKEQGKRFITIRKLPSMPSMPSKDTESGTNQAEKVDSISNNHQMPSNVPSSEINEKQAQNTTLDGKDSKDGILQADKEEELKRETPEQKYQREQEDMKTWNKGLES